jgi:ribosomal protein S18 acetylase RimI-like enzyme
MAAFHIRPYRPEDEESVYMVCLKTGDAGQDATALYSDRKALGHIYVGPYLHFQPELAFVLGDAQGVCGYVLGTSDTIKYYEWFQREWLPRLRGQYEKPSGDPKTWTAQNQVVAQYFKPQIFYPKELSSYPAHLHIDLLPRAQGQGWGKQMIGAWLAEARERRIPGVHLAVAAHNDRARGFYLKQGFAEIDRNGDAVYMGRTL